VSTTGVRVPDEAPAPAADAVDIPYRVPIAVVFVAVVMLYALWAAFTGTGRFRAVRVGYGVDSAYDLRGAKAPVWDLRFLAAPDAAPFLFLLLAKVCLRNLRAIVLLESAIAAACWLFLARAAAERLRRPMARTFGFTALLLLALSPQVIIWNVFVATESLSISLLALATGLFVRMMGGRSARRDYVGLIVVLALLACTRDSYATFILVVAAIAVIVGIVRRSVRARATVLAGVCVVAAGLNIAGSNHSGRWFAPLDETITVRLLGSHEATRYLVDHGLPLSRQVRFLHEPGMMAMNEDSVTYQPQYKQYRNWLYHKGRNTYAGFLLTHPASDLSGPFDDRQRLLRPYVRNYANLYKDDPGPAFRVVGAIAMPSSQALVEVWIALAVLAALGLARRRRDRVLLVTAGLSAFLCVVHFMAAWHGDALELDRHAIAAAVQLRIVLWILTALFVDELAVRRATKGVQSAAAAGSTR
jgi:hypothetical protein